MSIEASGSFGGALTYAKWKGRQYVRQLVTPSNPHASTQEQARNKIRVVGVAQHWANRALTKLGAHTLTDKALLTAGAPSGQAWNGYLAKSMIGAGDVTYTAGEAAYTALTSGNKTTWDTAAAALVPPMTAAAQTTTGGVSATAYTAGHVYFLYEYGLFSAGIAPAPVAGTPPTYA
jgi:hypothetical protein